MPILGEIDEFGKEVPKVHKVPLSFVAFPVCVCVCCQNLFLRYMVSRSCTFHILVKIFFETRNVFDELENRCCFYLRVYMEKEL